MRKAKKQTIRELRTERGWSQFQLAVEAGVTPLTVGNWERGTSEPRVSQLRKVAEVFGVLMDDIVLVRRPEAVEGKRAA